ncbi:MAG: hypothetical protein GY856_55000 [bacterium]|nr:hypothetical protein [bacterium]
MPDQPGSNVFSPEFIQLVQQREAVPGATQEATWAGPWRVEPQQEEFAVVRESDGRIEAVTEFWDTAAIMAATFPIVGRENLYCLESADDGDFGAVLKTLFGDRGWTTVGRLRLCHEGIAEPMSVAEHLLRSPAALAFLLAAAPYETLQQAGTIAAQRLANQRPSED